MSGRRSSAEIEPRPCLPEVARCSKISRLPTLAELRRFLDESPNRMGKREIARAFNIGAQHRAEFRDLLKELAAEGAISRDRAGRHPKGGRLPETMLLEVTGTDPDGDAVARPVAWEGEGPAPSVLMASERRGHAALAPGQRVLARLRLIRPGLYEGRTLKRIAERPGRVLGIYRPGRVVPTDRRSKAEWVVPPGEDSGAEPGEIVLAEPLPHHGLGLKPARVIERLGAMGDARSVSLIAIHTHGIPSVFPAETLEESEQAGAVGLGERVDLRHVPLVTIDGEDARDFDDAVYAEPHGIGFRLIVAIADAACYVRPGSALDREGQRRGNSVYFPDRVVPMLPESLSNGWCSLQPNEDRGCLFVEMQIDPSGQKRRHHFGRGLMRSAARLTYEQVQRAHDGGDDLGLPLPALYGGFRALLAARERRGTLDLDLPERKVVLNEKGHVAEVIPRPRLDSHRLIEEFMVLANVAAAEELERRRLPCMYRVHAPPSEEKIEALRNFLRGFGIGLPANVHPRDLDRVLRHVAGTGEALLVNEVVLRSQSQAAYSPDNIGHFGLALPRYAHFTSPIRRYADLLVHRALVGGLGLGAGGLTPEEASRFADLGEHLTMAERRAAAAERDAIDRYVAAYMAEKIGASFTAWISGVTRFALFVTVASNGANGIVPLSTLPDDAWRYDEKAQTLSGRHTDLSYRLAQPVEARLVEASPVTGGLVFHILQGDPGTRVVKQKRKKRPLSD
ncbi:MAG: ribonuclease R [Acetobacteraceae bacterium]|nr:ribonuclease R [Acetobacteraceae bacterium]